MKIIALFALATGCIEVTDAGGPWEDSSTQPDMEIGPMPALSDQPGCTMRIASWNLHKLPDPDDVLAHLKDSKEIAKADVLLVQETSAWPGETSTRTAQMAEQLGMTWAHSPIRLLPDGVMQGNAILSRYPLERIAVKRLPYIDQPYHDQNRGALAADVVFGDHKLRVVSVHLDVRIQPTDRIRQLDPAVTDMDDRAVVGGDLNTAPWQWIAALVPITTTEAIVGLKQAEIIDDFMKSRNYASALSPDTNTFTVPGFSMRLDNLFARGVPIVGAGIEHVGGSDHWPIYVDVDVCN